MSTKIKPATKKRAARKAPWKAKVTRTKFGDVLDLTDQPTIRSYFQQTLESQVFGSDIVRDCRHKYPISLLVSNIVQIMDSLGTWDGAEQIGALLTNLAAAGRESFEARRKNGRVQFSDIPLLLPVGQPAVTRVDGEIVGGIVNSVRYRASFFGAFYIVELKLFHAMRGKIEESTIDATVGGFNGLQPIENLAVWQLTDETKVKLSQRGAALLKIASGASFVHYNGQITRNSYWSSRNYRADGRVMIDAKSLQQIDSDQFAHEWRHTSLDDDDNNDNIAALATIAADDLWRTYPFVLGLSFRAKQWGRMAVSGITEIKWHSDAFEKLVLDPNEKRMVRALVEHSGDSFTDMIEGKGGGCIFLLHGPPGEGKTLTAEAVAELLHRPLYAVSVGELGITPDELEERLRTILDVATVWNAVVLLDEADIYLEQRDERDVVRNAMVGVFLRLLEYHQGVLFLTTNRVRNIDTAFYSRVSIALNFKAGDQEKRRKIWTNLLEAAKVKKMDISELAAHTLNGRQIKNVIRQAQTLAKADQREISMDNLREVIKLTENFHPDKLSAE